MANKEKLKRARRRELERKLRRQGAGGAAPSTPAAPAPSRWHQSPAADRQRVERLDGFAPLRNKLFEIAKERGDWAGIPMPLEHERLVVEPRYPLAAALSAMCGGASPQEQEDDGTRQRASFYSSHKRSHIVIFDLPDGSIDWGLQPAVHHLAHDLQTLGCAEAWGIEQESKALELLGSMLEHRRFKQYLLTGMFLETSKRSGVVYLFRRLKPTVAIHIVGGKCRVLCALCMHPIAYYAGSWAGAMCPTDDVVAHLSLMRGDEAMFWRRSTQHPAYLPEAGL